MTNNLFANVYFKWKILGEVFFGGEGIEGILVIEPLRVLSINELFIQLDLEIGGKLRKSRKTVSRKLIIGKPMVIAQGDLCEFPFKINCPHIPSYFGKKVQLIWHLKTFCMLDKAFESEIKKAWRKKLMFRKAGKPKKEFELDEIITIEPSEQFAFKLPPLKFIFHSYHMIGYLDGYIKFGQWEYIQSELTEKGSIVQINFVKNWHLINEVFISYKLIETVMDYRLSQGIESITILDNLNLASITKPEKENQVEIPPIPKNFSESFKIHDVKFDWVLQVVFRFHNGETIERNEVIPLRKK